MKDNLTVLYVEDEIDIRRFMYKNLSRLFEKVLLASNGEEGLALFKNNKIDIILTDITMPKMSGLELATKIKELAPEVPIVIVTAFSDTKFLFEAIEIGISKYLTKPIDTQKLKSTLEEIAKDIIQKREYQESLKREQELLLKTKEQEIELLKFKEKYNAVQEETAFKKELKIINDQLSHKLIDDYYFETFYSPIEHLSGDTYFTKELGDGKFLFYIIDAMGKGISASVTAIGASSYINFNIKEMRIFELDILIEKYLIYARSIILPEEIIATTFLLLDTKEKNIKIANFGMPPVLIGSANGNISMIKSNNLPITPFLKDFNIKHIDLKDIEKIMLYSDGIDEINTKCNKNYANFIAQDFKKAYTRKCFLENYLKRVDSKQDDKTAIFIFKKPKKSKKIKSFTMDSNFTVIENTAKRCERPIAALNIEHKDIVMLDMVIREMLINAFEHGNLGISFEQKQQLIQDDKYEEYIQKKSQEAEYKYKKIECILEEKENIGGKFLWVHIKDEGEGFDASYIFKYLNFEDGKRFHGRGIKISDQIVDGVFYNKKGNGVTIIRRINE